MFHKKTILKEFKIFENKKGKFYSLPALEEKFDINISRLPISIRIILESIIRNYDCKKITEEYIYELMNWKPQDLRIKELPLIVTRILLQDFTGIPLLTDLAAMRSISKKINKNPKKIEPLVPVDLIIDHSVQVDFFGEKKALDLNMQLEFKRNKERYQFIKWGMQAFNKFNVIPPGFGIVHQINLEYLSRGVLNKNNIYYPDIIVGTDSHTTMINSMGVVGWGVGGIEAEAGMLGQPIYFLIPDVIGVNLIGKLNEGVTATDLVLTITKLLRKKKVVGKFVEFFGDGVKSLLLTDRATISNMAPEYGSTIGFFPIDKMTVNYLYNTGRNNLEINAFESYFRSQKLFGIPKIGEIDYTDIITLNLDNVLPSLSGPKRPQDLIKLKDVKKKFTELLIKPTSKNGFNKNINELNKIYTTQDGIKIKNGDILIAAITSCTNTSNSNLMLASGLLAKKAVESGLEISPKIKTSLTPGSRVVTEYLNNSGLLLYLEKLGFNIVAYGCATCIGNSGKIKSQIEEIIINNNIIASSILSGNRNFEARIHPSIYANFLASPPLVIAYAIAGNILIDITIEPLGRNKNGKNIYLNDIWPSSQEINSLEKFTLNRNLFYFNYKNIKNNPGKLWNNITDIVIDDIYDWPISTYISKPPFFNNFKLNFESFSEEIKGARALCILGDSITTDHISPAGLIEEFSPAGKWLINNGVLKNEFNSYGSRRGNHEVMIRGTFSNKRIKNLITSLGKNSKQIEGGFTYYQPSGEKMSIYDAAMKYISNNISTIIFAGKEYGTGSSRDWAAKGTKLLGVKMVIARSFERIHRANLIGMGVLPLQFLNNDSVQSLNITGNEYFDLKGISKNIKPLQEVDFIIYRKNRKEIKKIKLLLRIDTPMEIKYYKNDGILPFVLRELLN
ncbi:aconitate hydratase AcnA [Candidatus Profftella armatura (Diaphorina cf. continua)]|uniref:Aconitate hydratase n=1 Tax=Candidatus Profftella armatura (Diaphorina cf. continua) TaxID=2661583 RepID=A0A7R6VYK6_9PROT|nr:aconitate hydratase AcnA [Candidatus Profftella armatura (Diaphorina cf. continua)]BCG49493.1 aconitate hydratase AcnA [Candidatus Profftella armatura (Diaphorina cf. continua)]